MISENQIKERVAKLSLKISNDFKESTQPPILLGVLNGSFVFMADLIRELTIDCEVDFCRIRSYNNNQKSKLQFLKRWELDFVDRNIVIVEDIVDLGETIKFLLYEIKKSNPKSISICSLLKRSSYKGAEIDYVGFEIESDVFLIGYGLDNNGLQRNLKKIIKIN